MRRANSMRRTAKPPAQCRKTDGFASSPQTMLCFARLEIIVGAVGTGNMERSSVGPDSSIVYSSQNVLGTEKLCRCSRRVLHLHMLAVSALTIMCAPNEGAC